MKKALCIALLLAFGLATEVLGAEVKVMRALNVLAAGEDCVLIPEVDAWKGLIKSPQGTTLKEMVRAGWKISHVEGLPENRSLQLLIIFTKD